MNAVPVQAASRPSFCYDTETFLIEPGRAAPQLVCLQWSDDANHADICTWKDARDVFLRGVKRHGHVSGHHVSFDNAVMASNFPDLQGLIFDLYDAGLVSCTMRDQQLLDTAAGKRQGFRDSSGKWSKPKYGLEHMAARFFGRSLKKKPEEDSWRLRYGELFHVPLEQWPDAAKHYALEDAVITRGLRELQQAHTKYLTDSPRKARQFFGLELMKIWGLRTSIEGVEELRKRTQHDHDDLLSYLVEEGVCRTDGSRDTKAAKAKMISVYIKRTKERNLTVPKPGEPGCAENVAFLAKHVGLPLTEGSINKATGVREPGISLDSEACGDSEDPVLEAYADLTSLKFLLSKDVAALQQGVTHPIHTRFDLLVTGRTSSSNPNVQNWSRVGRIRECFVPRPGHVFLQADYEGLELCTLAQVCKSKLGYSSLGDAINSGKDPHGMLGASILHLNYDEFMRRLKEKDSEVKNARQAAKPGNFGYPGGLGFEAFQEFAKSQYKVLLSLSEARELKVNWQRTWPEMIAYHAFVKTHVDANGMFFVNQLFTDRLRGDCTFTAAANSWFQGLGADATLNALWMITKECYVDQNSPLFNCRPVNYIHDEFFIEIPEDRYMHERAMRLREVMMRGANALLPDVPTKTSPVIMRYWSKDAHEMYDDNQRLIPWTREACNCKGCTEAKAERAKVDASRLAA